VGRSVVRTKREGEMPSSTQVRWKVAETASVKAAGASPRAAAASTIFSPCSSVPDTEKASMPRWRRQRTSVSATTVV